MRYGITGPAEGLTENQERFVADTTLFVLMDSEPMPTEFWSGCAHVVDSIGVYAAERARVPLIGLSVPRVQERGYERPLPSNYKELIKHLGVANYPCVVEEAPPGKDASDGYMKRNSLTVSKIDRLLAFPPTSTPTLRSGTWATIRRARNAGIDIYFYPLNGAKPWVESLDEVERLPL